MKKILIIIGIIFVGCKTSGIDSSNSSSLGNQSVNLYAFVGKKLSVKEFDPNTPPRFRMIYDSISKDSIKHESYVMDAAFKCQYLVIKKLFNDLNTNIIEFEAYDHYGRPGFENYNYALLYVSIKNDSSGYFHQKYQFDPVKKAGNGKWIGLNGESLETLFQKKKKTVFKTKGLFK